MNNKATNETIGDNIDIVIDVETTGLNPFEDRLTAIGIRPPVKDGKTEVLLDINEKKMLREFWELFKGKTSGTLIGFNIAFDWKFIFLRSLKYRIPVRYFSFESNRFRLIDIRKVLNPEPNARGRLKDYAKLFGINDPDDSVGSEMPLLWERKDFDAIKFHCKNDVELTYEVWDVLSRSMEGW